jgi:hypothetical protein
LDYIPRTAEVYPVCSVFSSLSIFLEQEPKLVGAASNSSGTVDICGSSPEFWLFLFIAFAISSFIFQEMSFSQTKWSAPKFVIGDGTLLAVFIAGLCTALAFGSYFQMFPYWVNAGVYVLAFTVMVFCGKVANVKWIPLGKAAAIIGMVAYLIIFGWATIKQYDAQHTIDMTFKRSIGVYREFIIKNDLSEFGEYFRSLNIPVPSEGPTIGLDETGNCSSWSNPQTYTAVLRPEIKIAEKCFTREEMTLHYSGFIVDHLPHTKSLDNDINHLFPFIVAQNSFSTYLNASYWDKNPEPFCPGGGNAMGIYSRTLWKIRQRLGKDFTDRMVAFSLRLTADDPLDGMDKDFGVYFARKLRLGDSVVDDGANWPIIVQICKNDGIKIENI